MALKRKYVVFDMDGVIFDTERLMLSCWKEACAPYGINDIEVFYPSCIGTNGVTTVKLFNDCYDNKYPFEIIRSVAMDLMHKKIDLYGPPVMPYAPELLNRLSSCGYDIALASSTDSVLIKKELTKSGLLSFFSVIIGGDMIKHSKPAPDIFVRACAELGCPPSSSYVIEDSENGIRSAFAAGTIPIMVPDMITPSMEVAEMCSYILPDLHAVEVLL